ILFTTELARRLEQTRVTANAVHPGGVATRLGTNATGVLGKLIPLAMRPFMKTPAQGAETSLYVATSPDLAKTNGRYFANSREHQPNRAASDPEAARRLWNLSCEWVGLAVEDTQWTS